MNSFIVHLEFSLISVLLGLLHFTTQFQQGGSHQSWLHLRWLSGSLALHRSGHAALGLAPLRGAPQHGSSSRSGAVGRSSSVWPLCKFSGINWDVMRYPPQTPTTLDSRIPLGVPSFFYNRHMLRDGHGPLKTHKLNMVSEFSRAMPFRVVFLAIVFLIFSPSGWI